MLRLPQVKTISIAVISAFMSFSHAVVLEDLSAAGNLELTLSRKKIGYYIGSFDPLHLGHEAVVDQIIKQNLCDYVLVCPAWGGDTYKNRTPVHIRTEMLFAAFADHPRVLVTKLAPGALQNILTMCGDDLVAGNPSVKTAFPGAEYIGVIGSDTALDTSKDPKKLSVFMRGMQIPEKYTAHTIGGIVGIPVQSFIVSLRAGGPVDALQGVFADRPIVHTLPTVYRDLSSTQVRGLVNSSEPIDNLVSKSVKNIILQYELYRRPSTCTQ